MLPNPYELAGSYGRWILGITGVAAVLLCLWLMYHGASLKTSEAPYGIVSFELCWTEGKANQILEEWEGERTATAVSDLYWDFLFIPAYSTAIALLCGCAATSAGVSWRVVLTLLAWLQWGAAILDVAENICLLQLLNTGTATSPILPLIAGTCAAIKFLIVIPGLGFGLLVVVMQRKRGFTEVRSN